MGRRSQEAEKPPPGPPPSYRHSQQPPGMNTLPPPSAGGQQQAYRQGPGQERAQFEGQAIEGRHSPQPPTSDRGESDPEKAFKDLRMHSPLIISPPSFFLLSQRRTDIADRLL